MAYEKVFATSNYIAKEIAAGELTLDDWGICYLVDGQGSAADELETITGGLEGQLLIIKAAAELTLKHGVDNILFASGADVILASGLQIILCLDDDGNWQDFLNVATPDLHASTHENGGSDEISLTGLSGEPADTVNKSLFDANTILAADADDTPAALEITEQTVIGRLTGGNIKPLSIAELQTLLFSLAMTENVAILLDDSLSADGKYSGFCVPGIAGATLAFGDLVYLQTADQRWELASADNAATGCNFLVGICVLAAANDGDATRVLLWGKVRADTAFPALTQGAPVYMSTTAGDIQTTAPSGTTDIIRIMGHGGETAEELYFNPSNDWLEHV